MNGDFVPQCAVPGCANACPRNPQSGDFDTTCRGQPCGGKGPACENKLVTGCQNKQFAESAAGTYHAFCGRSCRNGNGLSHSRRCANLGCNGANNGQSQQCSNCPTGSAGGVAQGLARVVTPFWNVLTWGARGVGFSRGGGGGGGAGGGGGQGARGGGGTPPTPPGCIEYPPSPSNNNRGVVAFWNVLTCPLTQWSPHSFTDRDVRTGVLETFHTAENFMMAAKARCARDERKRSQILRETDPHEVKKLGGKNSLRFGGPNGVPFSKWEDIREDVVRAGNLLKFGQNQDAANYLKSTGNKILVEGSPYDNVWGCGIRFTDALIQNPRNWTGQNKLGKILMEVRDLLP